MDLNHIHQNLLIFGVFHGNIQRSQSFGQVNSAEVAETVENTETVVLSWTTLANQFSMEFTLEDDSAENICLSLKLV